jgi:hypothetical protein
MTLDEDDRAILAGLGFDPDYVVVVDDWDELYDDDGPELPPSRRVVSIETTGERL